MSIGSVSGSGGIDNSGEAGSKPLRSNKAASKFDPSAQVSSAPHHSAAQARLIMQKAAQPEPSFDIRSLDMTKLGEEQLGSFAKRVSSGILRQEATMKAVVNSFAGMNPELRRVVTSLLLAP